MYYDGTDSLAASSRLRRETLPLLIVVRNFRSIVLLVAVGWGRQQLGGVAPCPWPPGAGARPGVEEGAAKDHDHAYFESVCHLGRGGWAVKTTKATRPAT